MADNKKPKEIVIPERKPPAFPLEILEGQDTEIITTERKPNLFTLGMPQTGNIDLMRKQFLFIGEWDPSEDPLKIGEQNFSVLENYRYKDFGLEGVNGYTKINTTALTTYLKGRSGIQLRTPYAVKSYVLVQVENTGLSASVVKENRTTIPSQGDFQASVLHTDAAGAGLGRFSSYPQGHLAYCNEKESCIYAGLESRCAGFFTLFVPKIVGSGNISFVDGGGGADTITHAGNGFIAAGLKIGHQITVSGTTLVAVATFFGSGLDDLTTGGTFSGSSVTEYVVEIDDAAASPDTFKWSNDGGKTWEATGVGITGAAQTLDNGVTVTFGAVDGHTLGEYWAFKAPANAGDYPIVDIAAGTITLATGVLTAEANTSAVITVSIKKDHIDARDYTEAINNEINAAAQCASIDGDTTGKFGLVLSTRPLKGVKFYIRTANSSASSTTFKVWDGDSFEPVTTPSDGTVSAGKSMAQTGTFSFDSTVATAKPLHFEGLYLYAYLFKLSAGSADIYHVTVDAPFQDMVDIWDGVYRPPVQFQVSRGLTTTPGATDGSDKIVLIYCSGWSDYQCYQVPWADYQDIEVGAEIVANAITATVLNKIYGPQGGMYYYTWTDQVGIIYLSADIQAGAHGLSYTYANPADVGGSADYNDYTMDVLTPSYTDYPLGAVLDELDNVNHILVAFEERVSAIWFEMIAALVNINSVKISSIGYWKGDDYESVSALTDSSQGLPESAGALKSFNRSGLVSWKPPAEEDEFRQTLFGVNAYFYKITLDGTLSGTWADAVKEVVIDTVKGIPAQRSIKGYKFPAHYRNRPLLCGFVDGKEGNRVDYGMANTTSVFNGEDSSFGSRGPLYFGGSEDLIAYCEIYNRFGSAIYTTGIFTKATETYILTGYDVTTWQIHQISSIIGCPASETMDTAEVGYDIGAEAVRNIAIWLSYMSPVIFDAGVLVPTIGEKIRCYFDKTDARCINYAAIDKSHGKVDPDNMEYNLWIPSGSGQTTCNVCLCLDLVRKKWFVKVPAGSDAYPQAAFRVADDYGAEYLYGLRDNGHMMRLEHGPKWDTNPIAQKVAGADLIPTGDMFDYTEIRRVKLACISTTEDAAVTIKHYKDGSASATTLFGARIIGVSDITFSKTASPDTIVTVGGNFNTAGFNAGDEITVSGGTANDGTYDIVSISGDGLTATLGEDVLVQDENDTSAIITKLTALDADGSNRHTRATQNLNLQGWSHRIEFSVSTSSENKGVRLLGWNLQYKVIREDT